jgi:putative ABC transport system permease protein
MGRRAQWQPRVRRRALKGRAGVGFMQSVPSALEALKANKSRSALTTLGIVIGVVAVIAIVGLGQGSTAQVTSQISNLGTNVLTIMSGSTSSGGIRGGAGSQTTLKAGDAEAIKEQIAGVAAVSPTVSGNTQVVYGSQNWSTRVQGVEPAYQQIQNWQVASGGFFTEADDAAAKNVAVIGQTVATNLIVSSETPVGQQIRIRNVPFVVVGVLSAKGSGMGGDQDDTVLVPFQSAQVRLFGSTSVNSILVQASSADRLTQLTTDITALLRSRHRLQAGAADDFTIRNNADLLNTITSVSKTLTYLLGGVAAVSLIVGGIGIMNIMLVSVTERTREIGIRMAIGARPGDILAQFMTEAVILSMFGGLIGVALGVGVVLLIPRVTSMAAIVPGSAIVLAVGFAALVGIVFGVFPARKASHLDPIDALRYQ